MVSRLRSQCCIFSIRVLLIYGVALERNPLFYRSCIERKVRRVSNLLVIGLTTVILRICRYITTLVIICRHGFVRIKSGIRLHVVVCKVLFGRIIHLHVAVARCQGHGSARLRALSGAVTSVTGVILIALRSASIRSLRGHSSDSGVILRTRTKCSCFHICAVCGIGFHGHACQVVKGIEVHIQKPCTSHVNMWGHITECGPCTTCKDLVRLLRCTVLA